MILINPIQSTIKLIECVSLCYSCPIKATWIHKALLQQIRVISFFYLTYVMTYKIKRKYIYVFQLLSPFFTLYKILCVCVCVYYELSMSINMVQWSLHKLKKKGQQTCHKNSHKFSAFSKSVFKTKQKHNLQHFPLTKDLTLISGRDPTWGEGGLSCGADYFCLSQEIIQEWNCWYLCLDSPTSNSVHLIIVQ